MINRYRTVTIALLVALLSIGGLLGFAEEHVALPADLKSAFETGVQAEIDNIAMYESFLSRELPADVREVFESLMNASKNHLRAFRNNLRRYS